MRTILLHIAPSASCVYDISKTGISLNIDLGYVHGNSKVNHNKPFQLQIISMCYRDL